MKTINALKNLFILICYLVVLISLAFDNAYAERFFQQHSTWYEKIPPNHALHSNSANIIKYYESNGGKFWIGDSGWETPIVEVDGSVANVHVTFRYNTNNPNYSNWINYVVANGYDYIPIPSGTKSAGMDIFCAGKKDSQDLHLTIYRPSTNEMWSLYKASYCKAGSSKGDEGGWKATHVRHWVTSGDGVAYPYDNIKTGFRTRDCTSAQVHGLLTYDEVTNDTIDHAIGFRTGFSRIGPQVYPCGASGGVTTDANALYTGERIQLDPSLNCNNGGDFGVLTDEEVSLCKALQIYGAVHIDTTGGSSSFMVEDLSNSANSWAGKFPNFEQNWNGCNNDTDSECMWWKHFRVIEPLMPNPSSFDFSLYTSGNLSVNHGSSVSITITASLISGTSQPVSFSISGLPVSATSSFSSITCNATCSTTLTIVTSSSTPLVTNKITVTGKGGGISKQTSFDLIVTDNVAPAPPPTMKVDWVSP